VGPKAAALAPEFQAAFGPTLAPGMRRIAALLAEAEARARGAE
jgi:hypothetical protein